ncbi:hypothetical protein VTJ49DRAFT_4257 [Mycothermus thermophilus]|uniref:N-acetyltransferase domain-containing protein n=1 Tax=Humicola insolens TaxID=85995 RepID=A0ABR3VLQ2_HUMIN
MTRTQQSSIRSFFQPRSQAELPVAVPSSAPPPTKQNGTTITPSAPPLPPAPAKPTGNAVTLPPNGVPVLPSPPSLPQGATIAPLEAHHIPALRRINSLLLPVPYPDSFYTKALDPLESGLFSRVILWQDSNADPPKVVGGLVCRLEPDRFVDGDGRPVATLPDLPRNPPPITPDMRHHAIYIQSLGLLSPYRALGLAAAALDHVIATAAILPAAGSSIDVRTVYAHVWSENTDGLRWYEARGFQRAGGEPVKGYYFKLKPDTAWVLRRHIGASAGMKAAEMNPLPAATTTSPQSTLPKPTVLAAAINLVPPPPSTSSPTSQHQEQQPFQTSPSLLPLSQPPTSTSTSAGGPPRRPAYSTAPSSASSSTLSFQNARPETEWNDLPPDMISGGPPVAGARSTTNAPGSVSSRSSSTTGTKKRRDRAYPTAAFGPSS